MTTKKHNLQHIFLTGLKHCGKTTLGKMLAQRCGRPFYDLDDLLLQEARKEGFTSVRELYRTAGREKFQEYEAVAAQKACSPDTLDPGVLSLGGGTIENEHALTALKECGRFIYLQVEEKVLFNRIQQGGLPPFLIGPKPAEQLFHQLYQRRNPLYLQHADFIVILPNQAVEANFVLLYSQLKDQNYVG